MATISERLRKPAGDSWTPDPTYDVRNEAADLIDELVAALKILAEEADNFNVSGVYFNEKCMGHKGLDMAGAALSRARTGS